MTSLVELLREDILNPNVSVSHALRKAVALSDGLESNELRQWALSELDGYDHCEIPKYRRKAVVNYGNFVGMGCTLDNYPIPLAAIRCDEKMRVRMGEVVVAHGVRTLESLAEREKSSLRILWINNCWTTLAEGIFRGLTCTSAWQSLGCSDLEQILDTIRTRLLNFALALRTQFPATKSSNDALIEIPRGEVTLIVYNVIFGGTNTVASGNDLMQQSEVQVR